jgi:mRNA interferase MazF
MSKAITPCRGEVWIANLDPTQGHEQAGTRPALILSVDPFNASVAGLCIAVPITSKPKGIPYHVEVDPPEGGLTIRSYIKCEDVRSLSNQRFSRRLGPLRPQTVAQVEDMTRRLLGL